ncbi:dihydropteroate synthase [Stieleria sp. JC731]|uniref:dihydropteroate synthase n=1 Tax=Pirellulaceae TaxID=2691357 RepID=UPI00396566C1
MNTPSKPAKRPSTWNIGQRSLPLSERPLVMGILNVTPDSFSDGGRHNDVDRAIEVALQMQSDGADIIDIGGESTRPYSDPVATEDEIRRTIPVIEGLSDRLAIPISIDTSKAAVASAAIQAGAEIINDVTGLEGDPQMINVALRNEVGICAMHMQGTPQTMQDHPSYDDVVEEIYDYLVRRLNALEAAGIRRDRICLDPGIGFGKTHEHNFTLLQHTKRFCDIGVPILIGHSRKGFIGKAIGDKEADRDAGTLGVSLAVMLQGADVIRVHNVRLTVDAIRLFKLTQGSNHQLNRG